MARTKCLLILLAMTLASCARGPQPQQAPDRASDGGGTAIEGSENRSDASRTRTRT